MFSEFPVSYALVISRAADLPIGGKRKTAAILAHFTLPGNPRIYVENEMNSCMDEDICSTQKFVDQKVFKGQLLQPVIFLRCRAITGGRISFHRVCLSEGPAFEEEFHNRNTNDYRNQYRQYVEY
jgi:hypothetical protein